MKTIKTVTIAIMVLLISFTLSGQNKATLLISQDPKLALWGDDKGNHPFTTNIRIASEWEGNQLFHGYFFGRPEFEYADLQISYMRVSLNIGYAHNRFSDLFDIRYSIGYGEVMRKEQRGGWSGTSSFGADVFLDIKVSSKSTLFINGQFVQRQDMGKWVYSNFIGYRYNW